MAILAPVRVLEKEPNETGVFEVGRVFGFECNAFSQRKSLWRFIFDFRYLFRYKRVQF